MKRVASVVLSAGLPAVVAIVIGGWGFLGGGSGSLTAADPLLEWGSVRELCNSLEKTGQMPARSANHDVASALRSFDAGLPPAAKIAAAGSAKAKPVGSTASLFGLSSSVVPAVTGDLVAIRSSPGVASVGQSLGQSSSLRLYRPSVGVSVGSSKPAFVGHK